jgi:hypothetical protein
MSDKVLKAFNTVNRRLKVNDPVDASDDLSPHSFEDLKSRGFIGSSEPEFEPWLAPGVVAMTDE